jgi:hypothetical protein
MGKTTQQQRDEWLAEFQAMAAEWGGECISDEYVNQNTKLEFICNSGHEFSATPSTYTTTILGVRIVQAMPG